jgi:hypothetical protein
MAFSIPALDPITGLPRTTNALTPVAQRASFNAGTSNAGGYVPGRGISTTEIARRRENTPMAYNTATGQRTPEGTRLFASGWNTSGVGPGTEGYRGTGRIGSAAGAVGSGGVPTSQRGRAEKYGSTVMDQNGNPRFQPNIAAAETPTWAMSELMRDNMGGLGQDYRFGTMGQVPPAPQGAPGTPVSPQAPKVAPFTNTNAVDGESLKQKDQPYGSQGADWFSALLGQFLPNIFS